MNSYTLILDKERILKYSNRSFRELEKRSGVPVLQKVSELAQGKVFSLEFITQFIWAGLIHENIPYEFVADNIPLNKYVDLIQFITKVVTESYGLDKPEDEKKNIAESQPSGIGTELNSLPIQTST